MEKRPPRKPSPAARPGHDDLLPDFCDNQVVLILVLIAEAAALVLTLSRGGGLDEQLLYLSRASLFILAVTLLDAALLCYLRRWTVRLAVIPRVMVLYALVQLVTVAVTLGAEWILSDIGGSTDLSGMLLRNVLISAIISGVALRYFYLRHQNMLQQRAEEHARMQALQARIRPHFLFNSLNTIANLVHNRPEAAEEAIVDLAELFRSTLAGHSRITLAQEMYVIDRYLRIEQLRLGERLRVQWDVPETLKSVALPALILQPLVENAVYHGIEPLAEGGDVRIAARTEKDGVHIEVTNPLPATAPPARKQSNRVAVDNIRRRLALSYEAGARLDVHETPSQYAVVLILPVGT